MRTSSRHAADVGPATGNDGALGAVGAPPRPLFRHERSRENNRITLVRNAAQLQVRWISCSRRISTGMNSNTTRWVVALTGIGSLMAALDTLVVSTALSTIRLDLGASVEQLEWTVNAYNLSFAVLLMTGAALGDRYGRRNFYAVGLGLFAAASAACALAPDVGWLIAARAVQGAGAALLMPLGLALLSAAFPPERSAARRSGSSARSPASRSPAARWSAARSSRASRGSGSSGSTSRSGWSPIPLVLTRMKESFGPDTALDIRGLALVTGGALGIVWGLVRGNPAGWGSLEVVGSLAAGALLVAAFVAWELRAREPMLPMRLLPLARLLGRQRGDLLHVRVAVQRRVLLRAAAADRARLRPARRRAAADALDRHVHDRRADRRRAARPDRRAAADGRRAVAPGGRDGLGRADRRARRGVLERCSRRSSSPASASRWRSRPRRTRSSARSRRSAIGKAAGTNSMMRELGGVFGIAVVVAVFAGAGSYASAAAFTDGFAPAIGVGAGLALAGAVAGLALPGRRTSAASCRSSPRVTGGHAMRHVMVRYKVKPDRVAENEALVRAVYEELARSAARRASATRRSGSTTASASSHIAFAEDGHNPLADVAAFQRFQEDIRDRLRRSRPVASAAPPRSARSACEPSRVVHLELHTGDLPGASAFYSRAAALATGADRRRVRLLPRARAGRRVRRRHRRVRDPAPGVAALRRGRPDRRRSTERAGRLGASVLLEPREGPAGWRSVVATPAGGEIAFWQPKP